MRVFCEAYGHGRVVMDYIADRDARRCPECGAVLTAMDLVANLPPGYRSPELWRSVERTYDRRPYLAVVVPRRAELFFDRPASHGPAFDGLTERNHA